jgi:hypothetical protein
MRRRRSHSAGLPLFALIGAGLVLALIALYLTLHALPEPKEQRVQPAPAPLKGFLEVGILEGGREPEQYHKYEVRLQEGRLLLVQKQRIQGSYDPSVEGPHRVGGEMHGCGKSPLVLSPDERYTAYCIQRVQGGGRFSRQEFNYEFMVVESLAQRKAMAGSLPEERRIDGIFWSPDSRAVAILSTTQRMGRSPLNLLRAMTGHPTPLVTTYLDTYDLASQKHAGYVLRRDAEYGVARIIDWWY